MSANLIYGICIALVLIGLFFSVQLFRGRMSFGQARYMGIPMAVFGWMIVIYYLALFEGVYGLASFILDLPLWVDVLLFLVILGLSMTVYFNLIHREKFKPTLFTAAFLVPLSIPGLHTAAKLIPKKAPVEILQSVPVKARSSFPQESKVGNSGYRIEFLNSHRKGIFGDSLTARRLTAQGYEKLRSKHNQLHGIDGVYKRYEDGNLAEILIVENKVDRAQLDRSRGQMTDKWVEENVDKMLANEKARPTGELIRANPDLVRKELWRHDLDSGRTTIHRLDSEANTVPGSKRTEEYISSMVRDRCESQKPTIVCIPVSQ